MFLFEIIILGEFSAPSFLKDYSLQDGQMNRVDDSQLTDKWTSLIVLLQAALWNKGLKNRTFCNSEFQKLQI